MMPFTQLRAVFSRNDQEEPPAYECLSCGACFKVQRQVCPEYGGYSIERTDWDR